MIATVAPLLGENHAPTVIAAFPQVVVMMTGKEDNFN